MLILKWGIHFFNSENAGVQGSTLLIVVGLGGSRAKSDVLRVYLTFSLNSFIFCQKDIGELTNFFLADKTAAVSAKLKQPG